MVVIVLTACPAGLRGLLTRWLLEISAGVFVGRVNQRVRDELWLRVKEMVKDGKALMVYPSTSEQGLDFKVHRHHWELTDLDGLTLVRRPAEDNPAPSEGRRPGWSKAARRRAASRK